MNSGEEKERTKWGNQVRNSRLEDWTTFSLLVRAAHPNKHLSSGENRGLPRMIFPDNTGAQEAVSSRAEMKMH